MGCIHIYCGDGKGKTTAAVGLAVRMAGCGGRVVAARFLKNDDSGELVSLRQIPGVTVIPSRKVFGFTWQMTKEQKAEAALYYRGLLEEGFQRAAEEVKEREAETGREEKREAGTSGCLGTPEDSRPCVLLILDEVCAAVNSGLLPESAVLELLDQRPRGMEVVMTGREPRESFLSRADYVTEMKKITHPFDRGISARKGIEY